MKKLLYIGIGMALTLVVLGAASLVYAQSQTPPAPQTPGTADAYQNFQGFGMMRGGGMMGAMRGAARQGFQQGMRRGYVQGTFGPMHEYMVAALAGKLNLSVEDLQAKITAGERPYDIAKAQGLTDEQVQTLMQAAHAEALKAAVAAGALTQEQADWMSQRMTQMHQNGAMGGRMGAFGANGFGGCPGMDATQP